MGKGGYKTRGASEVLPMQKGGRGQKKVYLCLGITFNKVMMHDKMYLFFLKSQIISIKQGIKVTAVL